MLVNAALTWDFLRVKMDNEQTAETSVRINVNWEKRDRKVKITDSTSVNHVHLTWKWLLMAFLAHTYISSASNTYFYSDEIVLHSVSQKRWSANKRFIRSVNDPRSRRIGIRHRKVFVDVYLLVDLTTVTKRHSKDIKPTLFPMHYV